MDESRELISRIVEEEFSESPSNVNQITGGLMNKTYRVDLQQKSYVVQLTDNTEPRELENCLKSFIFLQDKDVPVPKAVTREIKSINSVNYTVVSFVEGNVLSRQINSELTRASGRMLAHIHETCSFDKPGWIKWRDDKPVVVGFPGDSLQRRLENYMEEKLEYFQENDVDWLAEVVERFLNDYVERTPEDFEPVFVHHDYNPGNILVRNGRIVAVLDFDYSHASHSQRDLVKAMNKFWVKTSASKEDFLEGYQQVRDVGAGFEQNRALYELETLIDELKARLEFVIDTKDELREYEDEVERLESILSG